MSTDNTDAEQVLLDAVRVQDDDLESCGHVHHTDRAPWLRAAVLGANDGLVTVGALLTGIGAASASRQQLFVSAIAALVSGSLSMACGEFVSVSQQADTERADVEKERQAQEAGPAVRAHEQLELENIWRERGLSEGLAKEVAQQLTAHDAVRAHARDELGIDIDDHPNPWSAAVASALSFATGAALPTLALLVPGDRAQFWALVGAVTVGLLLSGSLGAYLGGFSMLRGGGRVLIGGWLAMAITYGVGRLMDASPA